MPRTNEYVGKAEAGGGGDDHVSPNQWPSMEDEHGVSRISNSAG